MFLKSVLAIHVYKDIQIQVSDIHIRMNSFIKSSKHATMN